MGGRREKDSRAHGGGADPRYGDRAAPRVSACPREARPTLHISADGPVRLSSLTTSPPSPLLVHGPVRLTSLVPAGP